MTSSLNATIAHHLRQYSDMTPELVELLSRSMYIDVVIAGADRVDDALKLYKESKEVMLKGDFNLRKFATNV